MVFPSSLDLASTSVKFYHPREAANGPEDCLPPLRCPHFKEKAGFSPLLHPRPVSLPSLANKHMWPPPLDPFSHPMTLLQRKKEKRGRGGEGRRAPRSDVMEKKSSRRRKAAGSAIWDINPVVAVFPITQLPRSCTIQTKYLHVRFVNHFLIRQLHGSIASLWTRGWRRLSMEAARRSTMLPDNVKALDCLLQTVKVRVG
jgi:hypothetical protein